MNLRKEIEAYIIKGNFDAAVELLKTQGGLSKLEKDELVILAQKIEQLNLDRGSVLTDEEADIKKSKISRKILALSRTDTKSKAKKPLTEVFNPTPTQSFGFLLGIEIVLGLLFGPFGELMPDESKAFIENLFGSYYVLAYWSVFIITFAILAFLLYKKERPSKKQLIQPAIPKDLTTTGIEKIKTELLESYKNRLDQKLDHRLPVHLKLFPTDEGFNRYSHFDENIILNQETTLWDALEKHQHLLLLGSPGSGKTTQVLELAIKWIEESEASQPIPILINLAPWTYQEQHFDLWLEEVLHTGHGFSPALAKQVIQEQQIFLLLDGLDEIGRDLETEELQNQLRSNCLTALSNYIAIYNAQYVVICSRQKEYNKTKDNAPVRIPLKISPLSTQEIRAALRTTLQAEADIKNETAAKNLLNLLEKVPALEEVLCTPFYYNIALAIFDTRSVQHQLPSNKKALEAYLVEEFIQKKLSSKDAVFTKEDTIHSLSWLAQLLNKHSQVTFELVSFQPEDLEKKWYMNLTEGLIAALFTSLFGSLFGNLTYSLASGLVAVLVVGLIGISAIVPNDIQKINWFNVFKLRYWQNSLFESLFTGLFGGFLLSFLTGLFGDFSSGLALGLAFGLIYGFVDGLVDGLVDTQHFIIIKKPFQRLSKELLFSSFQLGITLFLSSTFFLIIDFISNYQYLDSFSNYRLIDSIYLVPFILGIAGTLIGASSTVIYKHFLLRICLYWEKKMPWKWVTFFKYATKARLLEQNGGQWRFRHQILQDHFEELYKQKQGDQH